MSFKVFCNGLKITRGSEAYCNLSLTNDILLKDQTKHER